MAQGGAGTLVTPMLAVPDVPSALRWYARALGAMVLWERGSAAGPAGVAAFRALLDEQARVAALLQEWVERDRALLEEGEAG